MSHSLQASNVVYCSALEENFADKGYDDMSYEQQVIKHKPVTHPNAPSETVDAEVAFDKALKSGEWAVISAKNQNFQQEENKMNKHKPEVDFISSMPVLLIPAVDQRIICYFLGVDQMTDVASNIGASVPMIAFMQMQVLPQFMAEKGYKFAGETSFTQDGDAAPVNKQFWTVGGKTFNFTCGGFQFYEAESKEDNVVILLYNDPSTGAAGIKAFSANAELPASLILEIDQYTKKHNCLKGAKLRNINVFAATFSEVSVDAEKHNWNHYFYPENVQSLLDLEVFGFLDNPERYNKQDIFARGILTHGEPGTGKTTLGKIVCAKSEQTVIWITPELVTNNDQGRSSIQKLYLLADYLSPVCIILEDIDLFAEDRDSRTGALDLGGLMNLLDGVNSIQNAVTLAMTNRIELIEKALRNRPGRFDRVVAIPALSSANRKTMLEDRLKHIDVEKGVIDYIVSNTDGYTGAQVEEIYKSVNMYFISRNIENGDRKLTTDIANTVLGCIDNFTYSEKQEKKGGGIGFASQSNENNHRAGYLVADGRARKC